VHTLYVVMLGLLLLVVFLLAGTRSRTRTTSSTLLFAGVVGRGRD
jgi:hypothetical protein